MQLVLSDVFLKIRSTLSRKAAFVSSMKFLLQTAPYCFPNLCFTSHNYPCSYSYLYDL